MCYHDAMRAVTAVLDTNVCVAALIAARGYNREVLRACLENRVVPLMGQNLFLEYEEILGRRDLFTGSPLKEKERWELFDAFLAACSWIEIYFLWRPNLIDEEDNHVLELAVAGGASFIVTNNVRDFTSGQLRFPQIRVLRPESFLEEIE